jgi:hypothetical protein
MVIVMAEAVARVGPGLGMQPGGADAKKWRKVSNYIMYWHDANGSLLYNAKL